MNKFKEAEARAKKNIELDYDGLAKYFKRFGVDIRTKDEYEQLLPICKECCPDGFCAECGCPYNGKLILRDFKCARNNFV